MFGYTIRAAEEGGFFIAESYSEEGRFRGVKFAGELPACIEWLKRRLGEQLAAQTVANTKTSDTASDVRRAV